jgi:hypothetical protein
MNQATNVENLFRRVQEQHFGEVAATQQRQRAAVGEGDRHPARHPLRLASPGWWRGESAGQPGGPGRNPEQRREVRRGGGDRYPQRTGAGRILSPQGALCRADRRLACHLSAGERGAAEPRRADRTADGARADYVADPRVAAQRPRPGRGRRVVVAPKKVRAIWEEPADAPCPTHGASR